MTQVSPFERAVIHRVAVSRSDVRWLLKVSRSVRRSAADGSAYSYRRVRSWRLALGQALLAQVAGRPEIVLYALGGVGLYAALIAYLLWGLT